MSKLYIEHFIRNCNLEIRNYFLMFSDPEHNIQQLNIPDGSIVVDFGSGGGYYTLESAKRAGERGKVYAIDIQKELLKKIKIEANDLGLKNIETIWADIEKKGGTKLKDGLAGVGIVANVMFLAGDKNAFAEEVARVVKAGGKILIVDWTDSWKGIGPSKEHVVKKEDMRKLFENHGFLYEKDIDAGDHHFGFIMRKR